MPINRQTTLKGTELEMLITFSYPADPSVTLDTIDWYTEWYCGTYNKKKAVKIEKGECHRHVSVVDDEEVVTWSAFVDTALLTPGILSMRLMAYIPNEEASGGVREEYAEIMTSERIGE